MNPALAGFCQPSRPRAFPFGRAQLPAGGTGYRRGFLHEDDMKNAPPHPRHPLQDWLYYPLHDYRTCKKLGLRTTEYRRRCLELIAMIKGRK